MIIIVLPMYNEGPICGRLLDAIHACLTEERLAYRVIAVDDGSMDQTPAVLKCKEQILPLTVLRHEINEGLGSTIRDGLAKAAELAADRDIVITMDADETHLPGLILRMARMVREGHDVVIASRYRPGARIVGLSPGRRFLSWAGSWVFRCLFPTPGVRDFTCGYRAYSAGLLKRAMLAYGPEFVLADGFHCMVEILLNLRRMEALFGEVPIILRYDYKSGKSKMNIGTTMLSTLRLAIRRRLGLSR